MKTKEELNALKEEVETLNRKLAELSEDELVQVVGGQVVDPTRPRFGQDTRWDMICKEIFHHENERRTERPQRGS